MPSDDFRTEYLSHFKEPSEAEKKLQIMARNYHLCTEEYDRMVCTGPIVNGSIRPANAKEIGLINANARMVSGECFVQVRALGFTHEQWVKAIQNAVPH